MGIKKNGGKIIITLNAYRNAKFYKSFFIKYLTNRFQCVDNWIFSSYYSFLDFKKIGFRGNFSIIPLGLESISNIGLADEFKDILNNKIEKYTDKKNYIFYTAQFLSHKRHTKLLHNISMVLKEDQNRILILCGDGPLMKETLALAEQLDIRSQVKFLGRIDRNSFLSHLKWAKVAVVMSKTETFGHNILEPMMLNIPVVSTIVGIAPEIIKDGENGFLFDMSNPSKFRKALSFFCEKEQTCKPNEQLLKDFSWEKVVDRYCLAYQDCFDEELPKIL